MLSRRHFIFATGATLVSGKVLANANGFDQFLNQQQGGFDQYRTQLMQDFESYQQVTMEEFASFKASVSAFWGDEKVGSASEWVEYSTDLQTRTRVNFETGEMIIETIDQPDSTAAATKIGAALRNVAHKTVEQAHQDDQLSQAIEKRIAQLSTPAETATPTKDPVIADILTGRPNPTQEEIDQSIRNAVQQARGVQRPATEDNRMIYQFSIPLNKANISNKADRFRPQIVKYAADEKIDPALVLAIMHSESSFNPMAKSPIPAFGLMQIVPRSAGLDATEKVYGQQRMVSPSYLYNADNNIKLGCAYLHILNYRYLAAIENPESRTYCVIAAYNTGSGNVARAFSPGRNVRVASEQINRMTPLQVYNRLVSHLPYEETRNYMKKVTPRYQAYLA